MSWSLIAILGGSLLVEHALGRWGGPRWRSTTQAIGNFIKAVVAPTLGRAPLVGAVVMSIIETAAPTVDPCPTCKGSGCKDKPPKTPKPAGK